MSFTNLGDETAFGSTVSGNTYTFSTAALGDVVAGDLIVIFWDALTSGLTVASCTDNGGAGQVYDIASCVPKSGGTHSLGWILCKAKAGGFGTTITVTLSGASAVRCGTLLAFHASNGNPVLDKQCGGVNDASSPVDTTGGTGTLSQANELAVACWGWRGSTGVASGFAQTSPAGWTQPATYGQSGGTSRDETPVGFNVNVGSTASITAVATFTNLVNAHSWLLTFTDNAGPGPVAATMSSTGTGVSTFSISAIGTAIVVTANRASIVNASTLWEAHGYHLVNSIRGAQNGSGQHNATALAKAITACNQVFDGHAHHLGMNDGGGWQTLDPTPYGGYTVGAQVAGATLVVDDGTQFPAGGNGIYAAKVFPSTHSIGDDFTFTGVSGNTLTGCSGLPASIPSGSVVILFNWTNNGATNTAFRPLLFDNNQSYSVKELFDQMTGTKRTLVLHGASIWMHDQASMLYPPKRVNFRAWATACAEIAYQFAQNGTPLTHIGVWNEWKGYANHVGPGNQGGSGSLQSGQTGVLIPTDAGAGAAVDSNVGVSGNLGANGTEWLAYTMMYNEVWDQIKNHPSSSVNTLKVMGPHDNIGAVGVGTGWDHLYPFGTFDGTLQASGFKNGTHVPSSNLDRDRLCYFLDYATGYDEVTLDFSVVDNGDPGNANEAYVYANYQIFRDAIRQTKSVLANRSGLSAAKRAAPVSFIEYYADVNLSRISFQSVPSGGGFTDLQQGIMEACILRCFIEEGVKGGYRWAPMGDGGGASPLWNKHSYFLYTQVADAGQTRDSRAIVGESSPPLLPGDTTPAFTAAKLLHDNFPVGTTVYATTSSDSKVWGLASVSKTIVANMYATAKTVAVEGQTVSIPAYSLMAFNAAAATERLGVVHI